MSSFVWAGKLLNKNYLVVVFLKDAIFLNEKISIFI